MTTKEQQLADELARMMEELGNSRREKISTLQTDSRGELLRGGDIARNVSVAKIQQERLRQVVAGGDDQIKAWNNANIAADPEAAKLENHWAGQGHRLNRSRMDHAVDEQFHQDARAYGEERAEHNRQQRLEANTSTSSPLTSNRSRGKHLNNANRQDIATQRHLMSWPRIMLRSNTLGAAPRQRASSPRAAGTVRFIHGHQVSRPSNANTTGPTSSFMGTIRSRDSQEKSRASTGTTVTHNTNAAIKQAITSHITAPKLTRAHTSTQATRAPGILSQTPALGTVCKEVFEEAKQITAADQLTLSRFSEYMVKDMTLAQVQEIMKLIFDPGRSQWLEKHRAMLEAFDTIGRTLRASIMQVSEQDPGKISSFLKDYDFIPRIHEHVHAAKVARTCAKGADKQTEAWYECNPHYMPFYKMAKRMLDVTGHSDILGAAVVARTTAQRLTVRTENLRDLVACSRDDPTVARKMLKHETLGKRDAGSVSSAFDLDTSAVTSLELLGSLHKNARAMLARSSMHPPGLALRNGVYFEDGA